MLLNLGLLVCDSDSLWDTIDEEKDDETEEYATTSEHTHLIDDSDIELAFT